LRLASPILNNVWFRPQCGTFATGWRLAAFLDVWFGLWVAAAILLYLLVWPHCDTFTIGWRLAAFLDVWFGHLVHHADWLAAATETPLDVWFGHRPASC
jgi:hypothetical protein